MKSPRMILFGDSHVYAIQQAINERLDAGDRCVVEPFRLLKQKNGRRMGDTSFEKFLKTAASLRCSDVAISVIGGNQYAVVSTIEHPRPFTFFAPGQHELIAADVEVVPYNAIHEYFSTALRESVGGSLAALRKATSARVVHLFSPPPKGDNAFILQHHDSSFAAAGIATLGVSEPSLRLRFWELQNRVLQDFATEMNIEVMPPPQQARDETGFLARDCYANDATHANALYGELVLQQLEQRFLETQRPMRSSRG